MDYSNMRRGSRRAFLAAFSLTLVTLGAVRAVGDAPPESLDRYPIGRTVVKGKHPDRTFRVWIADNDARREQGLMYVKSLDSAQGMIFLFDQPDILTFWMKNTFIPLDLLYIGADGRVVRIAENAKPFSLDAIPSGRLAVAVLEINGGLSRALGLAEGDRVTTTIESPKRH
jgi:uncharacterized membrane protein (UPF0127 family)